MSLSISGEVCADTRFPYPFRILFSGSSQSGKTHVAGKLCENFHLFENEPRRIIYYYPKYLKEKPVDWDENDRISVPIQFAVGLPTQDDIDALDSHTLLILDDLFDRAANSECIDHLFRVTSGKRNLSVMIMTQNSYSKGKYSRDIGNSCNMQVLHRNCLDASINLRRCRAVGLAEAYKAAEENSKFEKYPFFVINLSPKAHRSNFRLFTDIFSEYPKCFSVSGMKSYIISENDFRRFFEIKEKYNSKQPTFHATVKKLKKKSADQVNKRKRYQSSSDESSDDSTTSSESDY